MACTTNRVLRLPKKTLTAGNQGRDHMLRLVLGRRYQGDVAKITIQGIAYLPFPERRTGPGQSDNLTPGVTSVAFEKTLGDAMVSVRRSCHDRPLRSAFVRRDALGQVEAAAPVRSHIRRYGHIGFAAPERLAAAPKPFMSIR